MVLIVFFVITQEMTPEYVTFVYCHVFNHEVFIIFLFRRGYLRRARYIRYGYEGHSIVLAQFTIVCKLLHHLNSSE